LIIQTALKLPIVCGYELITLAVAFVLLWLGVVLRVFRPFQIIDIAPASPYNITRTTLKTFCQEANKQQLPVTDLLTDFNPTAM
jgi:hypothetical protein